MSFWLSAAAIVIGLLCMLPPTWKRVRYLSTLVHESGHALVGTLTGGHLVGVVLRADSSGETQTKHYKGLASTLFSRIPTLLAGYPAPALFGGLGLMLALQGHANAGWLILGSLGILCLLFARSLFTVVITLPYSVGAAFLLPASGLWEAPSYVSLMALTVLSTILLAGAFRDNWTLTALTALGQDEGSDAHSLAHLVTAGALTRLWVAVFWLLTALCALGGGWLATVLGSPLESLLAGL